MSEDTLQTLLTEKKFHMLISLPVLGEPGKPVQQGFLQKSLTAAILMDIIPVTTVITVEQSMKVRLWM
ncbi:hypothetical protein SDC9_200158 [bioreactor metagenome]|uniref:Uncharacterized protein n=1 Tax=bioreactor metagenome TaxID=1076179 RepID=A0A645IN44_9ZZZZ